MPDVDLRTFAKRELESVREDIYLKEPRPLSGFDLFPQRSDIDAYAQFYVVRQMEMVGASQWFSEMSDSWPRADVVIDEDQFRLRRHGCAFGYKDDELERAKRSGRPLRRQRGMAARRATRERNNHAMFFGDTSVGLFGAVNYPGVPRVYFENVIGAGTNGDVILEEIGAFIDVIGENNETTVTADVVCLPPKQFNHIKRRPISSSIERKILEDLKITYEEEEVEFKKVPELAGAGPNGEDLLFAFVDDAESWGHMFPRPFTQEAPEVNFPEWIIKCHSKTGGVGFDFPLHAAIGVLPKS